MLMTVQTRSLLSFLPSDLAGSPQYLGDHTAEQVMAVPGKC